MARTTASPTPARRDGYPPAPTALSARQRVLWHDVLASKPPAWWDAGNVPLLRCLVGHIETSERVEGELGLIGDLGELSALARLEMLSKLRDRESRAVAMLSTKLRLSAQSRYTPASASTAARRAGAPAWDAPPPNVFEKFMLKAARQ